MIRAQQFTQGRRFGALAFLLVAYFFYAWSWNTVDILRPYIKESLGLTDLQAGSAYTLQSVGAIIGAVVMGQVADKIGRRNALVISMAGYGLGLLGALVITDGFQRDAPVTPLGPPSFQLTPLDKRLDSSDRHTQHFGGVKSAAVLLLGGCIHMFTFG